MNGVQPDDVPRSPSGRVPNWVIDEAHGRAPRDLVPFRAPSPAAMATRKHSAGGGTAVRIALTLAVVVGLLVLGRAVGGPSMYGGGSASEQPTRDWPKRGHEEARHPLGTPQPVALPSDSFRVLGHQDDGTTPVTWSPCRPLHYVVRPDNAPALGPQLLDDALAQVSVATGLRFVNDGTTDEAPATDRRVYQRQRYGDRWAPILVTWATPSEVPDFGVEFAGKAGPVRVRTPSGDLAYVSGTVELDAIKLPRMIQQGRETAARQVILHELGHLVGLTHVDDPEQLMFPRVRVAAGVYQPGDLAGLNALGSGPCQPDI